MRIRFDRFYDYAELTETLEAWAAEFPQLCRLESIGQSYEGREIWLVTVTSFETGPAEEKPALLLEAQIHGEELTATTAALHLLDRLLHDFGTDETVTRALETRSFYVVPRLSPDGAEVALAGKYVRSSVRPYPLAEPEDGFHMEDVDGDGRILMMRMRDENGAWEAHPEDPRLLVPREPTAEGGEYYRVLYEGMVHNWDGATIPIAHPLYGLDLNRNWPGTWKPENEQFGAGSYPASEPETRAIVQAIAERPNICGYIAYHTMSGVHLRPFNARPDDDLPTRDLVAYERIGREATRITGYPAVSMYHDFRYDPKKDITGGSDEWMYDTLGVFAWVTEFWSPLRMAGITDFELIGWFKDPPLDEQLALLRYADSVGGYADWYPFEHPQLGPVELGGWDDVHFFANPPFSLLEEEVTPHAEFALFHALISPLLSIRTFERTPIAGGAHRLELVVENTGWLPTHVTQQAMEKKGVRPVEIELELPDGARIVTGKPREEIGQLEGRSKERSLYWWGDDRSTSERARREWVVEAPEGARIRVVVRHERAGTARAELTIPAH